MASMIGPMELHRASQITFPHAILQYNPSIQFSNTILQYNSPIQVSNNPPIHVLCIPQSPPAAASAFFATARMVWAASFQKTVCQLSCQSLRHLHIQSFFPATSKVANPVNFITFLHKGSSP